MIYLICGQKCMYSKRLCYIDAAKENGKYIWGDIVIILLTVVLSNAATIFLAIVSTSPSS